ncbi:VRR-NUC domain-containing protein [Gorillibacterium sp. sgz5001074]|uniref:VRR-NUC domain-containing protein n=1 Tax=Gorillibacterium sp. sgz5001074 TaxID=3446695 RepID=UPI003F66D564
MRERAIETYLRDQVRDAGGRAYKFVSPGNNGVPDRLVILPGGRIYFVELKAPGEQPTKLQQVQHRTLQSMGCSVQVIDSKERVDQFIREVNT